MLVPKLRFPEFTDEWKIKKLSEISNDISYGMNSASKDFDGINKYIRITDINDSDSLFNQNNLVSPLGKLDNKFLVKNNDILFARTGASTGKSYLYDTNDGILYFAGFLIRMNINKIYNSRFIFEQFKLQKYNNWVKLMSMRSGQPGINANEYGSYEITITSKVEQDKLADFMILLNKKIELQSKKIEVLKLYSESTKLSILKAETSINNKKWKEYFLGEILTKMNDKNKNNLIQYVESVSNKKGFISQTEQFEDRNVASIDKSNYYIIRKNTFAYNPSRLDVGSLALKIDNKVSVVSPLYECFTSKENPIFLLEWFKSNLFKSQTYSKFEGGVRNTLTFNNLSKIKILLPDLIIQNKFACVFDKINKKIELEINKFEKLNVLKKSLMQSMFV